jgi:thiol:disulfide interchange protein DsbD
MKSARILFLLLLVSSFSPEKEIGQWNVSLRQAMDGKETEIIFLATLKKNWYVYSSDLSIDIGPIPTSVKINPDSSFLLFGQLKSQAPFKKFDKTWDAEISYFKDAAEFRQGIKILRPNPEIHGIISGQYCSEKDGQCIPFCQEFHI